MSESLVQKDRQFLWHPYTQMHDYAERDFLLIDRADGLMLYDEQGRSYFDTISSWWCIVHGHNHPTVNTALRNQLGRLEQVLLAGISHEPAIRLAEELVARTPAPLQRVFYSDNGSCACEIAVKMSLQYWRHRGHPERCELVAIERGYHGDTIGTMSLGGVPEFHKAFSSLMFESHRLPSPYCYRCPAGQERNSCALECLKPLEDLLAERGEMIAAFILEPLVQAAGGMIIYPQAYLEKAAALSRQHGVHLILDEVATGFGRTGKMFAMEHVGIEPDFLCLSKGLTAGYLPMAATMTTEEVFSAFYGEYAENKTFYHGHTFTGNPLAAAAALGSLAVFDAERPLETLSEKTALLAKRMGRFRELPWVGDVRQIGMIAVLELVKDRLSKEPFSFTDRVGWKIYLQGLEQGLILRPLGNIVYLWLPLSTTLAELDEICDRMWAVLADPANISGWRG